MRKENFMKKIKFLIVLMNFQYADSMEKSIFYRTFLLICGEENFSF